MSLRDPEYLRTLTRRDQQELLRRGRVTVNDVRASDGRPPIRGGDEIYRAPTAAEDAA